MLKLNPYATHILKKGDGCCEPISPLILGQIKQISVKKKKSFYCLRGSSLQPVGYTSTIYFSFRIPDSLLHIHFPTQVDFIHSVYVH